MLKKIIVIYIFSVLILIVGAASADVIGTRTRTLFFQIGDDETVQAPYLIPLNNAGRVAMSFNTTVANQKVVITFNALCGVLSTQILILDITISVDGVPAKPTNVLNGFCSTFDLVSASKTAVIRVPNPGAHTVQVTGSLVDGSDVIDDQWLIGPSSTIIMK